MEPTPPQYPPTLRRALSLPLITLYGLGTTIGAGIYVLVGKVASTAGMLAPISFLLGALMVSFTAFTFAELSSRMPKSAGEAVYVHAAFRSRTLALAVGLLVAAAGAISSATIVNGFVGYARDLLALPAAVYIVAVVAALGLVAAWGIAQSVGLASLITVIEIGGLLAVSWGGADHLADIPARWRELVPHPGGAAVYGIVAGGVLAFYAFIGFEDMVNVAEEVTAVERTLPRAIVLTLVVTTALYLLLTLVAVLTIPPPDLAASEAPLSTLFERGTGLPGQAISGIALVSVINGALIQTIMGSRVLYGLASQGWLPRPLSDVSPRTRTPVKATAVMTAAILALALFLPLVTLAKATSLVVLMIFAVVNLALLRIKRQGPPPPGTRTYPAWVPLFGLIISGGGVAFQVADFLRFAGG
jgi:amino acid transporter